MDTQTLFMNWGFTRNPFRDPVAELEQNSSSFFVMPPYFSEVVGSPTDLRSLFVFGHRGDGKSTLKSETQKALDSAQPKLILIEYSSFSEYTEETVKAVTLDEHLEKIIRATVESLLKEIENSPLILTRLKSADLARLQWYLFHFTSGTDWKETENRFAAALNAVPKPEGWKRAGGKGFRLAKSYLRHKRAEFEKLPNGSSIVNDIARLVLLLFAPDIPGSESLKGQSRFGLLKNLLDIIISGGLGGLVILVDRIDETQLLNDRPDLVASLILPLALAAPVLEMPSISIKFFLPSSILDSLGNRLRTDRVKTFEISWDDSALRNVIKRRLTAFSAGRVSSLDFFIEDEARDDFYKILLYYSAANPRNMFRLIDSVVTELCNMNDSPTKISRVAIESGLRKFTAIRSGEFDYEEYIRRIRQRQEEPPT